MNLSGLPDDTNVATGGLDLKGLPDDNARLLRQQYRATQVSPDDAARDFNLAQVTGVPKPVVERNRQKVEQLANEPDWSALEATAPVTVGQLAANAKMFQLARDDTPNMSAVESAVRQVVGPVRSFGAGLLTDFNAAAWGLSEGVAKSVGAQSAGDYFNRMRKTQENLGKTIQGDYGTGGVAEAGVASGFRSFGGMVPTTVAAVLTGNPSLMLAGGGVQAGGQATGQGLDKGLSPSQALLYGAQDATAEIATEMIPVARLFKDLKAGTPFFKLLGRQIATEVPTEMAATAWQNFNAWANLHPDRSFDDYVAELGPAEAETVIATVTQTVLSAGMAKGAARLNRQFEEKRQAAAAAETDAATLQQLNALAAASKLRARDPQSFEQFVAATSEDGPVQDIYVDARALQQAGVDLQALAQASPAAAAQVTEALATGGDIVIPVSEYAARVAGTDLDPALTPHLRTSEDGLSLDEAQRFSQSMQQEMQQAAQQAMAEREQDVAWRESAKQVETELVQQLRSTGRFTNDVNTAYATLLRDFYVSTAQRLSITPTEMFQRYPLQVRAESVAAEQRMEQSRAELTVALDALTRDDLEDDQVFSRPLPAADDSSLSYVGKFGASALGTGGMHVSVKGDGVREAGPHEFFFHDNNDQPIGYARLTKNAKQASVNMIALQEDARGQGFGKAFYKYLLDDLGLEVKSDKEITEGTAALYQSLAAEYPSRVDSDGRVVISPRQGGGFNQSPNEWLKQALGENPEQYSPPQADNQTGAQDGTRTNRPGVPANQEPATVGGGAPRLGWAESTRVRTKDGRPAVVYRGAGRALSPADFGRDALGVATGNPSSGLGVWFTFDRQEAAKYGDVVEGFHLDIRNPKVYKGDSFPAFDSLDDAQAFARELQAQGFDGIAADYRGLGGPLHFVAFGESSVIRPAAPKPLDMGQFFQSAQERDLIIQHNLSAENVMNAVRVGGLAVPSLAVTRADNAITGFGEITLLGDAGTATPGGDTKVFGADIYSPRYPSVEYKLDKYALGFLNKRLTPFGQDRAIYGDEITRLDDLVSNKAFQRYAADKLGESDPNAVRYQDLQGVASALFTEIGATERIFQGYTNSGNRRYIPHTLDNVVKILKKELRGGENFNYGVGSVRAQYTPQFRSLNAIRKEKDRLVSREDFEKVKKEVDEEFFQIGDALRSFHPASNSFGYSDAVSLMMSDAAKMGLPRALQENGFTDVTPEAMGAVRDYLNKLRDLPTEYFEAKITRAVGLSEFAAAVVPDDVKPDARAALEKAGLHVYEYPSGDATARRAAVKKAAGEWGLFFQPQANQEGNRAEISFARDITAVPSVITLFKNADLSSFLHEMGHFQLEVLAHIASQPDAPQAVVGDFNAALNWFKPGMTLDQWNAMDLEEKRPYHEQFARGFEAYLFEGKSPNAELDGLFARFRAWLINVYKSVKALNVELNDEIRGVFDRLVATQDAIEQAEAVRSYAPLFTEAPGSLNPAEWEQYQDLASESTQKAITDLQKRSLRDMQWLGNARSRILKQLQRDAKDKRKAVETEVRAEVQAMPVYAAQRFLKRGEITTPEGEEIQAVKGHKLDVDALAEMYPESMLARPNIDGLRGMTRKEGLHPDLVAEMFGFTSGDQLVREILDAEPEAQLVEGMTDRRVLERYGDLANPDTIARAADEAIHNEARARFVATELKALTAATGPVRAMTKAAKDFAENLIARKKLRDIKPNQHATAEARAAKAAQKALAAGDTALAATEKRNQLVQNYATRTAYDALDEIDKAAKYLRKFDSEGTRKNLDTEYLDQIDQLLERFDLRASTPLNAAKKRANLLAWVESQREQGFEPDIPPDLLTEASRKPYRELTLEEMRGLVDTVKQIEHLGRLKKKMLTAKDEREFQAVRDEIAASIGEHAKGVRDLRTRNTTGAMLKDAGNRFLAMHRKMASVSREMDGFKDGGPMWEYLIRSMNAAGDRETTMRAEATAKLYELVKPLTQSGPMGGKGVYFETLGGSFNREERIAIALNLGNAGNMQRLLDGEGWTLARLQPLLDTITPQEAQFVQAVWDFFESYRPEIAAKERRIYGKEPEWVEPVPITLGGTTLRGGYYPIKYDTNRSGRAEQFAEAEAAKQQMRGAFTSATTRRSFTKGRAEEVTGRPLLYNFSGVYQGTNEVIHDLAWHEWLIDANRLVRSLDTPIRAFYGPETVGLFKKAIEDIAAGDVPAQNVFEKGINHLRVGATVAGLGWNFGTALLQPFGLTQSMVRVGPGWVAKGLSQWIKSPIATAEEVREKSAFMRDRARTMQREINEIQNQIQGSKLDPVRATFFMFIQKAQIVADMPTWLGAYEKAIAEGNEEDRAVSLADQAVMDAQGGGQVKDLAQIQRGSPLLKLWTNFYSFFNVTYNLAVEKTKQKGGNPKLYPSLAMDYLLLFIIPSVMVTLVKSALQGDAEDEDKLVKKLIADQISYLLGTIVGLREVTAAAQKVAGVEQFKSSYGGPAGLRVLQEVDKLATQTAQGEADAALLKAANNVAGNVLHYPSGQINRTVEGAAAMIEGKTQNPASLMFGPPKP